MSKQLAILGASGHGKVVGDSALEIGWEKLVFFDDGDANPSRVSEWPVEGGFDALLGRHPDFAGVVVAIGNNRVRLSKTRALMSAGAAVVSLVHPKSYVSRTASVSLGCVVFAGAVVQPGARLGSACIVNTGATVDHDCVLADGVHICPGAHLAGGVSVGECAWVGVGSSVRQYVSIGADAVVGAGAAVVSDVAAGVTVVGVPARPLAGRA
jgi:sugar O-acyltransferase (sialic acid O-acetyltransferase NeuD family)